MATPHLTFGSLFAGIGGMELGLERAGMKCRWQIEIDPFCVRVLARHWPEIKRYEDIRSITGNELEPVDLICGGFPCQDLSQAGKRAGIEGTRSGLWFEFARLVGRLGPRWVLIENVPGLLVHDAMRRVIAELARRGYVGCWRSLRASEFGASHLRKRVFIVAYRAGNRPGGGSTAHNQHGNHAPGDEPDRRNRELAHGSSCGPRIEQNEPGQSSEELPREDRWMRRRGVCESGEQLADAQCAGLEIRNRKREQQLRQIPEPFAPGLPSFAPGPADPRWPGILAARPDLAPALESPVRGVADGLPDWMDRAMNNRTKRLGRLGNAVVPDCAEWIGLNILEFERMA